MYTSTPKHFTPNHSQYDYTQTSTRPLTRTHTNTHVTAPTHKHRHVLVTVLAALYMHPATLQFELVCCWSCSLVRGVIEGFDPRHMLLS